MVKESKHCSHVMKKYFYKELVMSKIDDEDFESFTKCWICDNTFVDGNVKIRGRCHITRKYRGSTHRYCAIKLILNHKTPVVLCNLKNDNAYLIMQEIGKLVFKVNKNRKTYEL